MRIAPRNPDDLSLLQEKLHAESDPVQRDRYRVVLLAIQGHRCAEIVQILGKSIGFVQRWAYAYRDGGIEAIFAQEAGRPTKLTPEQEQRLLLDLRSPESCHGDQAMLVTRAGRILRDEFRVQYTLSGIYALLHRLGLEFGRARQPQASVQATWTMPAPGLVFGNAVENLDDAAFAQDQRTPALVTAPAAEPMLPEPSPASRPTA